MLAAESEILLSRQIRRYAPSAEVEVDRLFCGEILRVFVCADDDKILSLAFFCLAPVRSSDEMARTQALSRAPFLSRLSALSRRPQVAQ